MITLAAGSAEREHAGTRGKGRGSSDMLSLGLFFSGAIARETTVPAIQKPTGTDAEEKSGVAADTGEVGRK